VTVTKWEGGHQAAAVVVSLGWLCASHVISWCVCCVRDFGMSKLIYNRKMVSNISFSCATGGCKHFCVAQLKRLLLFGNFETPPPLIIATHSPSAKFAQHSDTSPTSADLATHSRASAPFPLPPPPQPWQRSSATLSGSMPSFCAPSTRVLQV
jgi:hypothetical protein